MKSKNQEIRIIRKNGFIKMYGNGDMDMWVIANGMFHRGQIAPRKRDKVKKFLRCCVGAFKWEMRERADKINKVVVGTEEAITEFIQFGGYLN